MSDEKKLSERVREGDFDYEHSIGLEDPSWLTDTDKIADEIAALEKRLAEAETSSIEKKCEHKNRECTYESDDGEFERWKCGDCGESWGVEIAQ